jgi:hypothetical protein
VLLGALAAGWMLWALGQGQLQLQVAAAAAVELPWLCLQVCCCLLTPASLGAAEPATDTTA